MLLLRPFGVGGEIEKAFVAGELDVQHLIGAVGERLLSAGADIYGIQVGKAGGFRLIIEQFLIQPAEGAGREIPADDSGAADPGLVVLPVQLVQSPLFQVQGSGPAVLIVLRAHHHCRLPAFGENGAEDDRGFGIIVFRVKRLAASMVFVKEGRLGVDALQVFGIHHIESVALPVVDPHFVGIPGAAHLGAGALLIEVAGFGDEFRD